MICASLHCLSEFEPERITQRFCSAKCRKKHFGLLYAAAHPEKAKAKLQRLTAKRYKSGRLPKWMFD